MLITMADGSIVNRAEIICAHCHKTLSYDPPPVDVKYWFAFCSAECCTSWYDKKPGKVLGV